MDNLTIKLERDTAQALDKRFDNNDLASGAFIRPAGSTNTYLVDPDAENFADFKSGFITFAAQIQKPKPGTANQAFVDFAKALADFDPSAAVNTTAATASASAAIPAPPIAIPIQPAVVAAKPEDTEITVVINKATTAKFFDASDNQVILIPKIMLQHYCKKFAGENRALPRYLERVYARASDQGITVADLDIPGIGAQRFKHQIIEHFKKVQVWGFSDIRADTVTVTEQETTINLAYYKGAILLSDHTTGFCQIEIINNSNEHHIFVMEDGNDLQAPTTHPDFAKLDAIRWEILKEL